MWINPEERLYADTTIHEEERFYIFHCWLSWPQIHFLRWSFHGVVQNLASCALVGSQGGCQMICLPLWLLLYKWSPVAAPTKHLPLSHLYHWHLLLFLTWASSSHKYTRFRIVKSQVSLSLPQKTTLQLPYTFCNVWHMCHAWVLRLRTSCRACHLHASNHRWAASTEQFTSLRPRTACHAWPRWCIASCVSRR